MKIEGVNLPVIRANARLDQHPFEAISPDVLGSLRAAAAATRKIRPRKYSDNQVERVLKTVEAALRVMGRKMSTVCDSDFEQTCGLVVGALASEKFMEASRVRRTDYIGLFRTCLLALSKTDSKVNLSAPLFTNLTRGTSADIDELRTAYEGLKLVDEQVWLWRGWYAKSAANVTTYLPLYNVYRALGRQFTNELHQGICLYVGARAAGVAPLVKALANFIGDYPASMPRELRSSAPASLNAQILRDPFFADLFWRGFLVWYVTTAYSAGVRMTTITSSWNGHFTTFIADTLAPLGIFALPPAGMPKLDAKHVPGERTHIRVSAQGQEYKRKLLTDIPLQATDEQALRLLVTEIECDLDLVLKWSRSEVEAINMKVARRKSLAPQGTVRVIQDFGSNKPGHKWLTSPSNPAWLANAAATFEHYGFLTETDSDISLLYSPLALTARELGLPASDALNPYLNLLVAEHPAITPNFLRSLELFNKNGARTGFTEGDGVATLHGIKRRRGPSLAAQDVTLTPNGRELVLQIIELTQPLRVYLRAKGDGLWRRLLLSSGQGFGYPKPFRTDPAIPGRMQKNATGLAKVCNVSEERALALLKRCRLPAIRASKGVLIYVETGSVQAMAKALGHAEYDEGLLSHYLPRPIAEFFRERWIRLFQTGVILEALKGSPYRFRAAAFSTAGEMDEFLKHHAIRTIALDELGTESGASQEVIFGLDVEILTLLASLCEAVEDTMRSVNPIALYWAKVAHRLFAYIESPQCMRHDIRSFLTHARSKVDVSLVERVLYA